MIKTLQAIGDDCGLVLDGLLLSRLNLRVGSLVEIDVTADGKGLLLTPVEGPGAEDAHRARVREASLRAIERHGTAFRRLAE
ncbi:hypothetical protein [Paludisphaera mucosa]|uniref:SpoVT-AbrB domain-containing protein n=1 Tax=Paludisphaera mucosa TaxID=3030827 RepID=A0ABT6FBB3_9BACT|nr:hypothetical protein [Paludisphaera mucosa]MDG3004878.1 hypothetical protein [Paludisphaera mucosa]